MKIPESWLLIGYAVTVFALIACIIAFGTISRYRRMLNLARQVTMSEFEARELAKHWFFFTESYRERTLQKKVLELRRTREAIETVRRIEAEIARERA
ncbi:MAG: hypothetical protein WCJ29_05805 [bacterium]